MTRALRAARNLARSQRAGGEVAAATHTLAAASQALLDDPDTGALDWRMLAAAWWELGDRETASHYLAHGRARATTAEELCDLAGGYRAIGELAVAAELVSAAEAGAGWLHVAFAWEYELGDPERAAAAIDRGLREATSLDDAIALIKRRPPGDDDSPMRAYLMRAATLARNTRDWIDLAGALRGWAYEPDGVDPHLDRAFELATAAAERHEIEVRRCHWAVGPGPALDEDPRLSPSEILRGTGRTGPGWRPDPARLFDRLRAAMTREQIVELASRDYGYSEPADLMLLEICDTGKIPHGLSFQVMEELQLERWSTGPTVDHRIRAFACAVLCIDAGGPDTGDSTGGNLESAVPVLLESCIALGPDVVEEAAGLLAAITNAAPSVHSEISDTHHVLFAELGLILAAAWLDPGDPRLEPLIKRLIADEQHYRATINNHMRHTSDWLLGLTNFDLRHHLWRSLARQILAHPIPHLERLLALLIA